jgi:RNA polymerase sigma-70 factor (ECF subfamily)
MGLDEPLDDSVLWSLSRAGDAEAFGQLFERHARTVYNFCFRRVGDWSVAEELVSVVFLEAWRRRAKELPPGKVLPWLLGVATNVVRNRRRSERRYAAALGRVPRPRPDPGHAADADARVDDEREMKRLLGLVSRLPRHSQDVFVLCVFSGLSYEDAALALEIPIGTVRSRLSRARERFRELDAGSGHETGMTHPAEEPLR